MIVAECVRSVAVLVTVAQSLSGFCEFILTFG